jgi:branched-chain amino acid transport system permease protein
MNKKISILIGGIIFAIFAVYIMLTGSTTYIANIIVYICLFVIAGQGWDLLGGYIGEISFGHAVFFGIGAYSIGLPMAYHFNIPIPMLILMGVGISAGFALLISWPLFRVKGFPFLIGTFGLGVVFLDVFKSSQVLYANKGIYITSIPTEVCYLLIVGCAIGSTLFVGWLVNTNAGLKFTAVRDAPGAAEMIGINIYRTKTMALVIGAALTGLAGCLYAFYSMHITPATCFDVSISNDILLGSYVGGCGTVIGPVIGAFVVLGLQEWARGAISVSGGHNLVVGLLLIVVMMISREGIWPTFIKAYKKRKKNRMKAVV